MTALLRMATLETRFFVREPQALVWTLFLPVFMLVFFGYVFSGLGYVEFLIPGLIGMNLMSVSFFSMGAVLVSYRERGVLRRLRVTPMRPWSLVGAQILNRTLIALAQSCVLMLLGYVLFDARLHGSLALLALVLAVGLFAFMALGFAIASLTTSRAAASGVSQVLFLPMLFLGGAYFPVETFPGGLRAIGRALPLAPFLDAFRMVYAGGGGLDAVAMPVVIVAAWGAGALLCSALLFRWE